MEKDIRGRVVSVNISRETGVVKNPIKEGVFIEKFGLEDDAHGGDWHRQVSLLAIESFSKMGNIVQDLRPGIFAENITTEGIELYTLDIGTRFKIGGSIQELTQIGKKCHTGCEITQKVGRCVMPTDGIFTKVIKGGLVKEGDLIEIIY